MSVCASYARPLGVLGGPCVNCGHSQPEHAPPTPSITCPVCHRTSYNYNDVLNYYCGYCHKFHDEMED